MSHRLPPSTLALSTTSNATSGRDTSVAAPLELQNLTPQDIEIIDAVIERAGSSANTFFVVFKAYSDVLKERGLDPQEVVYYGKLLKLGTMKGKNWGDKWSAIRPLGSLARPPSPTDITSQSESDVPPSFQPTMTDPPLRNNGRGAPIRRTTQALKVPRVPHTPGSSISRAGIFEEHDSFLSSTVVHKPKAKLLMPVSPSEGVETSPLALPSYKATMEDTAMSNSRQTAKSDVKSPLSVDKLFAGKKIITAPKQRTKPSIDLDDAWKNIKMEEDEKTADEFRDTMLVARCWEIWRQGLQWITTTHAQIQEARDTMALRLHFQKWRVRLVEIKTREDEMVAQFSTRKLQRLFAKWNWKYKQKRQAIWRQDMRQKMKLVRAKTDSRTRKEAWTKWQNQLLLHRAHRHYELGVLFRYHNRWRERLVHTSSLDEKAENFAQNRILRIVNRSWDVWRRLTVLQTHEAVLIQQINRRITISAFGMWQRRIVSTNVATIFQNKHTLMRALSRWKRAQSSLLNLEHKAKRYQGRQDDALKRAIVRIWRARMRGFKLERFRETVTIKSAWRKWRYRKAKEEAQLDVAQTFFKRLDVRLAAGFFRTWQQVQTTHRNAGEYAIKYHEAHVYTRIILAWRMRLHDNLQQLKVARWAHRYFATRQAWRIWIQGLEERKRQSRLQEFEMAKTRRIFTSWKQRVTQTQQLRQCEFLLKDRIEKRIMHVSLLRWTNRVIELKSRELDVAQRADAALVRAALNKWRASRRRHIDEVSLLENYLLVKREDQLRRVFLCWLAAKRASEHRRSTHRKKEDQLRRTLINSAWDKWREKFREEKLRPLEYQVILDNQRYILRRAFGAWLSKADSLPAIRFHSRHLKEIVLKKWKAAMPNALKAKRARETDRHNTLASFFEKWRQTYKTKTTLKAVARAKYLRLPTSTRALSNPPIMRAKYPLPSSVLPRRQSPNPEDDQTSGEELEEPMPMTAKANPLPERGISRLNFSRKLVRSTSPARSTLSLPRRSRSPETRRGPVSESIPETAKGSDGLWDALRRAGQTRRPRNF